MDASLFTFPGGLALENHKALSLQRPLSQPPLPPELVLPLQQQSGPSGELQVAVGDRVGKGQALTHTDQPMVAALHAPSSGVISEIAERPLPHATGLSGLCVVIQTDGQDRWIEREAPLGDDYQRLNSEALAGRLRQGGIVGLGGAGFPTAVKLQANAQRPIDTLIVNAAECEPYITCDQVLLRERAQAVLRGAEIAQYAAGARRCLIGIEDHMQSAIEALTRALDERPRPSITLVPVPSRYPTGGEKQLIQVLTGKRIRSGGLPSDEGIVCQNVGTLYAIHRLIDHAEPLIQRIVTLTGQGVAKPQNLEALIGTPVRHLIEHVGGFTPDVDRLLFGGPMMGFALRDDQLPLIKTSNCVLAGTAAEFGQAREASACIRCGACAEVCPSELQPQQLYWFARHQQFDKAQEYQLRDCIECGCCDYVCPSAIPLTQYFRYAKTEIKQAQIEAKQADQARLRHEARQARLARQAQERERKLQERKAAAERLKAEKAQAAKHPPAASAANNAANNAAKPAARADKIDAVAAAIERAKAKKAARQAGQAPSGPAANEN